MVELQSLITRFPMLLLRLHILSWPQVLPQRSTQPMLFYKQVATTNSWSKQKNNVGLSLYSAEIIVRVARVPDVPVSLVTTFINGNVLIS